MKKILGLDLGTNSIGWAVVNDSEKRIEATGSRIIPMDASIIGDFEKGNSISQTKDRTRMRGTRRLLERQLLRRERLNRILQKIGFLPKHYESKLDRYGKFIKNTEPKIAWLCNESGKHEFYFKDSFNEMLNDFKEHQPLILENGKKIPYDWTIYYLRKKALTNAITKEELSWLLLNFNQKRGYFQLRGEDDDDKDNTQRIEYQALKVVDVIKTNEKKGKSTWYNVVLENGWIYRRLSEQPLDWIGKTKEFIVTTNLNEDGSIKVNKEGEEQRSFRAPKEDDWTLIKKKTENAICNSGKTVGVYIYDNLVQNPDQKINGVLVKTIERKFYKTELIQILNKQKEFIPELNDKNLYKICLDELYPSNDAYRNSIQNRDFTYLFVDDIIFYQRPLKSQKSTISNCPLETRYNETGKEFPIKCIAKSNPYFQEFRLWQFISNLKIYKRQMVIDNRLLTDVDVTKEFLKSDNDYVELFKWLNDKKSIKQETLLAYFKIKKEKKTDNQLPYRWNYVEDKEYPCNKTRASILAKLEKTERENLSNTLEYEIWHLLYSVTTQTEINAVFDESKKDNQKGLYKKLREYFSETSIEKLKGIKFEEQDYGSYSEKAIKRLLPLMRIGEFWTIDNIDKKTLERIEKIISGEYDEKIKNRVREKSIGLSSINDFQGLPIWLACYIVYNKHAESSNVQKWSRPEDIDTWLSSFHQHSLRNPIVEQVITETMRVVRDIWKQVGQIDEIHIELGREMKNPADKRAAISKSIQKNEDTNLRIKAILQELMNPEYGIENVRPYSPSQLEILKIYEENVLENYEPSDDIKELIKKLSQTDDKNRPSSKDILRYKCWLEQKYRSPYTGEIISLSRLFTEDYEIEHIIPQSRYFDDSLSNKVICESEVNKLKTNLLGLEFIKEHHGEKVTLSNKRTVTILDEMEYQKFVSEHYSKNTAKMQKLLMEDIPDGFIERQLNDSRYISKYIKSILSNIVRSQDENGNLEEEETSKNLISCNGNITCRLKTDWGINDIWNKIILPRFQRLNELADTHQFTSITNGHEIPAMPLELSKGFSKKRIDHRHHAMDAIVIACTTRDHINLLNNESAKSTNKQNRYALSHKLRKVEKTIVNGKEQNVFKEFIKPWDSFCKDTEKALNSIIVSFKQNLRIINKTVNRYEKIVAGEKIKETQCTGQNWSIRKSMHKDTVFGEVNLRFVKTVSIKEAIKSPDRIVNKDVKIKIKELINDGKDSKAIENYFRKNTDIWSELSTGKVDVYYYSKETKDRYFATRFLSDLVVYFANTKNKEDAIKKIEAITDSGIQKILKNHLEANCGNPTIAFSADGIDKMNLNIQQLNGGKQHKPIYKVRRFEKANKFAIGETGNKSKKFVEADKETLLFFVILKDNNGNHSYLSIPFIQILQCQKTYSTKWKIMLEDYLKEQNFIKQEDSILYILSPNDLVYVPTKSDITNGIKHIDPERIYKVVSFSGTQFFCIKASIAKPIVNKYEFTTSNKMERAISGEMIKENCIPLSVDRLGNIKIISND